MSVLILIQFSSAQMSHKIATFELEKEMTLLNDLVRQYAEARCMASDAAAMDTTYVHAEAVCTYALHLFTGKRNLLSIPASPSCLSP